jgi:hypothetical protein
LHDSSLIIFRQYCAILITICAHVFSLVARSKLTCLIIWNLSSIIRNTWQINKSGGIFMILYILPTIIWCRVTCGAVTAYTSGTTAFTPPSFQWGSCYSILSFLCNVLYIVVCPFSFCLSLFDLRLMITLWPLQTFLKTSIVLSVYNIALF